MKKPFLLIAGDNYYPGAGTDDWIGCYETQEDAESQIVDVSEVRQLAPNKTIKLERYKLKSPNHEKHGYTFDWYDILDLRSWTE